MIERGLRYDQGLLCVIDGAKELRKAIQEVFGSYAHVQRRTWHKRENVAGCPMSQAYGKDTNAEAKQALQALQVTLPSHDRKAANSLAEGMEETLTLHKLSMVRELRCSP